MDRSNPRIAAAAGFTLLEMVAVIVVLAILAALGGQFVVKATDSYQSTRTRTLLVNTGRQAVERMSRQLRMALPYSVRVTNNGNCLEFMPIASGGIYSATVADTSNAAAAQTTINASPYAIEFGTARYASIGAMAATELYAASPASLAALASPLLVSTPAVIRNQISLSAAKTWQRNSINRRFYLLDSPQAFCIVGTELRFYQNQALNNAVGSEVDVSSSYSLMAANVTGVGVPFSLSSAAENRNTNAIFNINFVSNGQSVAFNQSVMIRNVP